MLIRMNGRRTGSVWLALGLAVALLPASPARAQQPAPGLSREAIEEIVREYILKHPEVLLESVEQLRARQQAEARERAARAVVARSEDLTRDPTSPVAGNPGGDVTVVEFFDYQCGYCKAVAGTVRKLLEEDPNVRLVYKELPVLGPESLLAARAALAAVAQARYVAFHDALMAGTARLTMGEILRIAGQVGLDTPRLERDMNAPEIRAAIQKNQALARAIGISGTPAFVVGAELVPGALDLERLKELVARARAR